jgi:hypothetical protein
MNTVVKMNWKQAAGLVVAAWLTGGAAAGAGPQAGGDELTAQQIAAKARDAYAALSSYEDSGTVASEFAGQNLTLTFNTRMQRPNLYRIDWVQGTGLKGAVWSDGSGDYLWIDPGSPPTPGALAAITAAGWKNDINRKSLPDMKAALALATPLSSFAASTIPGAFFNQNLGDVFAYPAISGRYPLRREKDGKVGTVECYVVSTEMDLSKVPEAGKPGTVMAELWIGKADFLVHQSRTRYVEKVDDQALASDQVIDEAIKKSLALQNKPVTPEAIAALRPQMRQMMKQVQSTIKAGFQDGMVMTQTHQNIVVNPKFAASDFAR